MSKLFLILAILASGAASYVAWENKQTYGEVTDANKSLDKELLG
jgi:archaellum component FlaF (FlaF/FlaG flagellin family)